MTKTQGSLLGTNLFAYCDNNPVNKEDQSGYLSNKLKKTIKDFVTMFSKGGKSQPNSKFRGIPDDEINAGANDKSLSAKERREYQQEQKYRGIRNPGKRKELFGGGNKAGRKNPVEATPGVKWGVVTYFIISEGSRIFFPPRNLVPIL